MTDNIYTTVTTFGSFRFAGNFADASSPIISLDDDYDDETTTAPFQVADADHSPYLAARMLMEWFGREYWLALDADIDDENETYDGLSQDEYIDSLIVSVS